jgi:hypothetical protein
MVAQGMRLAEDGEAGVVVEQVEMVHQDLQVLVEPG